MQNLRRGHYEIATDGPPHHRPQLAFDALAAPSETTVREDHRCLRSANATPLLDVFGIRRDPVSEPGSSRRSAAETLANDRQIDECVRLYAEGWSTAKLGQKFSVDAETVRTDQSGAAWAIKELRGLRRTLSAA